MSLLYTMNFPLSRQYAAFRLCVFVLKQTLHFVYQTGTFRGPTSIYCSAMEQTVVNLLYLQRADLSLC